MQRQNSAPNPDFLDLSPNDMTKIIYHPFNINNDFFNFTCQDSSSVEDVPMMKMALYFMEKLQRDDGMKSTQKGNLPRDFVRELYEKFPTENDYFRFLPNKEEDFYEAIYLREVLTLAGIIKKRSNKFLLTEKGNKLFNDGHRGELYTNLAQTFIEKWNWGYGDRYSELTMIQDSAIFNFILLSKKCQDWTHDEVLGELYLKAFPTLLKETRQSTISSGEDEIIGCFSTRFLTRVCLPLGILEFKWDDEAKKYFDRKRYFRVTTFFKNNFYFNEECKNVY